MKKTPIIVGVFVLICLLLIGAAWYILPMLHEKTEVDTSDAANMKGKVVISGDNWVGYSVFRSSRMKQEMRNNGYALVYEDEPDYEARMEKLRAGTYNFVLATVDSYLLNAASKKFPGTFIAVVDESQDGDMIVGYQDVVPNLEALKTAKVRVAFTPNSPSHHLLKAAAAHFDIGALRTLSKENRIETNGSTEALKRFRDEKIPVAVLWEPDASRALAIPGVVKLLGTGSTRKLIVDTLVVNREYSQANGETVSLVLGAYFRALKYYREHPDEHVKEVMTSENVTEDVAKKMLAGCRFVNLTENCQEWFGIGDGGGSLAGQGLVDTIDSSLSILMDSGDFKTNPLPNRDPYRIINRSFLEGLHTTATNTGFVGAGAVAAAATGIVSFPELSPAQWDGLKEVGTLRVEPITFQSGTAVLTLEGREQVDVIAERLMHYPSFRILVKGHTNLQGDPDANRQLSAERAEAVARYLNVTHNIDPLRVRFVGYGGTKPLQRMMDESDRAYHNRLSRVEVSLMTEVF